MIRDQFLETRIVPNQIPFPTQAKIKVMVKRIEIRSSPAFAHCFPRSFTFYVVYPRHSILGKHGYPPDLQDQATKTVRAQAELLCADWAA